VDFFIGFYDLGEEDLFKVIEDYRICRRILVVLNTNFIDLIPKSNNPSIF
jgi:hypothetical protein